MLTNNKRLIETLRHAVSKLELSKSLLDVSQDNKKEIETSIENTIVEIYKIIEKVSDTGEKHV